MSEIIRIVENGKTFEGQEPYFTRVWDHNWCGKHTTYTRCNICGKLVSRQWRSYHKSVHIDENPDNRYKINF